MSLCRIDLRLVWSPYPTRREIQNTGSTAMKCEPGPMEQWIRKPSCQMYAGVIHQTRSRDRAKSKTIIDVEKVKFRQ